MEELCCQLSENVSTLVGFLDKEGRPLRSFQRDAPATTLPPDAPEEVKRARQVIIDASMRLHQLALGPSEYLPNLATGYYYIACLRWLCHFSIFSRIPIHGSVSYATVATEAGVPVKWLQSIARMAMTSGLLQEPYPNELAHSETSALLVTGPKYLNWAKFMCECSAPTATKLVEATERWPRSQAKNETAYNIAFNTTLPFFDHLALSVERSEQFTEYMQSVTTSEGVNVKHLIAGFDWAALGNATVVDVGGSSGHASIALAKAFPDLEFIVQDLQNSIEDARKGVTSQDESIQSRISFQTHDFFTPQTVPDADVYLLRMILHDWPDREAQSILSNLVPAAEKGAWIIIMDSVLPSPGSVPSSYERLQRVRDLTMMMTFNSHERSAEDWNELLQVTDRRFKLVQIKQPMDSLMAVMEVVLEEEK